MNFEEEVTRVTQSTWLHDISDRLIITNVQLSDISDRFFITSIQLSEGFFVPAHPLWMILVPYIVYLTFASFLCPTTCLPSFLPLAPLATLLGTSFPLLMGTLSAMIGILHIGVYPIQAWHLATNVYSLNSVTVSLWIVNVFLFGIFGFWPLAFPDIFYLVRDTYCAIPGASCFNV